MLTRTGKFAARLGLESLENRLALAAFATLTVGGNLWIECTDGDDTATVRVITGDDGVDSYQVTINGVPTEDPFPVADVPGGKVFFYGKAGNDTFDNQTPLQAVAYGGEGDDTLTSQGGGYLAGEAGNDVLVNQSLKVQGTLIGGPGNDTLTGGAAKDMMYGEAGNDVIQGNGGDDYIEGGAGNDTIDGGMGTDTIFGGAGDDVIHAGADTGANQIDGGPGSDRIYGSAGNDTIWCGDDASVNYVWAGAGNDSVYGGAGIDFLNGEAGNDLLVGGNGDDRLYGGLGYDRLYGQNGNDYLDGGNDGTADYLVGGLGRDWFHQERIFVAGNWRTREIQADYYTTTDLTYV